MIKSLKICVTILLLLPFAGCDTYKTYSGQAPSCIVYRTSVWGNVSWGQRNNHRKVLLKKEKLDEYLMKATIADKPLYKPEDLKPLIPAIQKSLAECGNVEIARATNDPFLSFVRYWVIDGVIHCEIRNDVSLGEADYTNEWPSESEVISEDWIEKP